MQLNISKNLKSANGIELKKDEIFNLDNPNFKDSIKARNMKEISVKEAEFSDVSVGARIFLKDWVANLSSQFIKIDGIKNISLGELNYDTQSEHSDDYSVGYYVDVKSNEMQPNSTYNIKILKGFGDNEILNRKDLNFTIKTKK